MSTCSNKSESEDAVIESVIEETSGAALENEESFTSPSPPPSSLGLAGLTSVKRNEDNEKELAALLHSSDPHVMETQRRVTGMFGVFDQNSQKIIDVRDVGCIIRSLGLFPTQADVHQIIQAIEESSSQGFVKYEKFVPYVVRILLDGNSRFQPPSSEMIRKAFKSLDKDRQGRIEPKDMKDILMKQGEKFSQEEFDKFLKFATNPRDNKIHWEVYLQKLNFD